MKRFFKLFLLVSISLISLVQLAVAQKPLIDDRDGNTYRTVLIGSTIWMAENLRYETDNSHCPTFNDSDTECEYGNFYDYKDAAKACPKGWRLPTLTDWDEYVNSLTDSVQIQRYNFKNQYRVDLINANVFNTGPLDIKSISRVEGNKLGSSLTIVDYWTTDLNQMDPKYHMHLIPGAITGHTHKHHIDAKPAKTRKFPIRCICK